jgi:hypothetical protein
MATFTPQQVKELAEYFLAMAQSIGAFRRRHFDTLSIQQREELKDLSAAILKCADDLFTLAAILVMDDVKGSLIKIGELTDKMKHTYQTLQDIQKGINIASAALSLCDAVIKTDPGKILVALDNLSGSLKSLSTDS